MHTDMVADRQGHWLPGGVEDVQREMAYAAGRLREEQEVHHGG